MIAAVTWLGGAAAAWAQAGDAASKKGGGGGSYVQCYGLTILGIALGLLLVCNSSKRREREKPEGYEDE